MSSLSLVEMEASASSVEMLDREKRQLQSDFNALRWVLEMARRDKIRLIESAQRALSASARLTVLYAAVDGLHSSLERAEVMHAIHDIILNVIGADRMAIFEIDHHSSSLKLVDSAGLSGLDTGSIGIGDGIVGNTIATRRLFLRSDDPKRPGLAWEETMTACIPLHIGCRPVGAIAILGLREQKNDFTPIDVELFSILATHAAMALRVSALECL
jgi:GAF domain